MAISWRVYYGDGLTCDSERYAPHEIPRLNIQAILQSSEEVGAVYKFDKKE